jgi:hypothetical protein
MLLSQVEKRVPMHGQLKSLNLTMAKQVKLQAKECNVMHKVMLL